jgi:transposase
MALSSAGACSAHTHQQFIRFLNAVERAAPADKPVHAILDNYATHKHPKVKAWLARHPRWVFHFTPTSGSWLNAVENFFSALTRRRLRRGVFRSIADLQTAINRYLKSKPTMTTPNPSSGPNPPTPFSPSSADSLYPCTFCLILCTWGPISAGMKEVI